MTLIALIRHGPSRWNERGLIQGRTDIALSAAGRAEVTRWRIPAEIRAARWFTSPLLRAVQTARGLGITRLAFEPRLVEMSWGAWEGRTLEQLRAADPQGMNDIEARGLDFSAPGGESPRVVQARLEPWLETLAADAEPAAAVTHKGVIRALFARASGWNMLGRPPAKLEWSSAHLFRVAPDGTLRVERLNVALRVDKKGARS